MSLEQKTFSISALIRRSIIVQKISYLGKVISFSTGHLQYIAERSTSFDLYARWVIVEKILLELHR